MDQVCTSFFKMNGGLTYPLFHAHHQFEVAIPEGVKLSQVSEYEIDPQFKLLSDVQQGLTCVGKSCVWPVHAQ